jgi:two-component system sensor histidine kinase KdpD
VAWPAGRRRIGERSIGCDGAPPARNEARAAAGHAKALLVVAFSTGLAALMHTRFERANLIMVYLVGVVWIAVSQGRGPAVVASILSVAAFDYFFVPPNGTFAVSDTQYLVTFAVMLLAAMVIATLAARLRAEARTARIDERRAEALARLGGELLALRDRDRIAAAALRHLEEVFESRAVILLPNSAGQLTVAAGDAMLLGPGEVERGVAQWAFDAGQPAGLGTDSLPDHRCLYLPLRGSSRELGVIALAPSDLQRLLAPDSFRLLEAFASHAALALERAALAEEAERARVQGEAERMRSALLSSVSHDLRTPLAVITGAASTLIEAGDTLPAAEQREILRSVADEATRLHRLVGISGHDLASRPGRSRSGAPGTRWRKSSARRCTASSRCCASNGWRSISPPTCRWSRSTTCCSSRWCSTWWRMRSVTRPPRSRSRSGRARG